jgi:hypothetical protein
MQGIPYSCCTYTEDSDWIWLIKGIRILFRKLLAYVTDISCLKLASYVFNVPNVGLSSPRPNHRTPLWMSYDSCGFLFSDAVSSPEPVMANEQWIEQSVVYYHLGLIWCNIPAFTWSDGGKSCKASGYHVYWSRFECGSSGIHVRGVTSWRFC